MSKRDKLIEIEMGIQRHEELLNKVLDVLIGKHASAEHAKLNLSADKLRFRIKELKRKLVKLDKRALTKSVQLAKKPELKRTKLEGAYVYVWFELKTAFYVGRCTRNESRHNTSGHNENAMAHWRLAEANNTFRLKTYERLTERGAILLENALIFLLNPIDNRTVGSRRACSDGDLTLDDWI